MTTRYAEAKALVRSLGPSTPETRARWGAVPVLPDVRDELARMMGAPEYTRGGMLRSDLVDTLLRNFEGSSASSVGETILRAVDTRRASGVWVGLARSLQGAPGSVSRSLLEAGLAGCFGTYA